VLQQIDRRAWATGGSNQPGHLDEAAREDLVHRNSRTSTRMSSRGRLRPAGPARAEHLDLELLAARAVSEADARSAPYGSRFSRLDIRAGATRTRAAYGMVGEREALQATLDEVVAKLLRTRSIRSWRTPTGPTTSSASWPPALQH